MNIKTKATILVLLLLNTFAFGQGVKFKFMTINEALAKAKIENKTIFLHNGERCGWGQRSIKFLEASSEAGDFFNKNFINVRPKNEYEIDAVFSVSDSPRYFFITPNGKVVMMISLLQSPEKLIRLGKKVLDGKVIKPNLRMYTNKMYKKNKNTLLMLSSTLKAYNLIKTPSEIYFETSNDSSINDFQFSDIDETRINLQESLSYGKYYFNLFLSTLIYAKNNEDEKAKQQAQQILESYPPESFRKERILTDYILKKIIEEK